MQTQARSYADYEFGLGPYYSILGLTEEVGVLSEKLRHILQENNGSFTQQDKIKLSISIGDTLFWLLNMMSDLNVPIEEVFSLMMQKQVLIKEKKEKENKAKNIMHDNTEVTQNYQS